MTLDEWCQAKLPEMDGVCSQLCDKYEDFPSRYDHMRELAYENTPLMDMGLREYIEALYLLAGTIE